VLEALGGRVVTPESTKVEATAEQLEESVEAAPPATKASTKPLVTALTIAADAGVGRRRTQVILHLLKEAGLIRRGRRGYMLTSHEIPSDAALEHLLETYVARAAGDRERLAEMMHYAESPVCRTQILREYFGEPSGERCGRCDNCSRPAEEVLPVPHEAAVTRVETINGGFETTSPETLPKPELELPFKAGDRVRHKRFGQGKVVDIHDQMVLVRFETVGAKRLRADFLRAA